MRLLIRFYALCLADDVARRRNQVAAIVRRLCVGIRNVFVPDHVAFPSACRDRSPRSTRQYHKFRLKKIGRRYRTDA